MPKKRETSSAFSVLLTGMLLLSLLGILTSAYLVYNHYNPPLGGSGCDFGELVSCSLVNTSVFSELFGVSVALFGVVWFALLLLMILKTWNISKGSKQQAKYHRLQSYAHSLLFWNILGILFVAYLVIAEIILKALCPYCTLVHAIILINLVLSFVLVKKLHLKIDVGLMIKESKNWIATLIVLSLLIILFFNLSGGEKENHDELAKCMTEKGIKMYGSFRCGVCAKTRSMFGDSFQYINEVECHPQGENSQTELCLEKGIEATPTWILEIDGVEQKRHSGFMDTEELGIFSGCDTQ